MENLPGVTYIPKDIYNWEEIADNTYDIVMSSNTFSFVEFFWQTMKEMARVVKPQGIVYMITSSIRHDATYAHYCGCWGINIGGLYALAKWSGTNVVDASVAGVPYARAGYEWDSPEDDAVLIAVKGEAVSLPEEKLKIERKWKGNFKKLPLKYYIRRRLEGIFHHYSKYRG